MKHGQKFLAFFLVVVSSFVCTRDIQAQNNNNRKQNKYPPVAIIPCKEFKFTVPRVIVSNEKIIARIDRLIVERLKRSVDGADPTTCIAVFEDSTIYVTNDMESILNVFKKFYKKKFKGSNDDFSDFEYIGFITCKTGEYTVVKIKDKPIPWIKLDNSKKSVRKVIDFPFNEGFIFESDYLILSDLLRQEE